jgi:hypothetical protein
MKTFTTLRPWILSLGLILAASPAWADGAAGADRTEDRSPAGSVDGLALSGDAGYYTYGMDDVNSRFNQGGSSDIRGGLGYGVSAKLGLTDHFAAKVGIDYLFASRDSTRTIGATTYDTRVDMPATMLFLGGEYVVLPLGLVNLKLIGGYTLVNIFNGDQRTTNNGNLDLGAITGTGSGFQVGAGAEVFLARGFSLEGSLAYNYAKINGATFAGPPADPGSTNSQGTVDYSGLVAKVAFNIYLFR